MPKRSRKPRQEDENVTAADIVRFATEEQPATQTPTRETIERARQTLNAFHEHLAAMPAPMGTRMGVPQAGHNSAWSLMGAGSHVQPILPQKWHVVTKKDYSLNIFIK